jgi:hypothetical protein
LMLMTGSFVVPLQNRTFLRRRDGVNVSVSYFCEMRCRKGQRGLLNFDISS